MGQPRQEGAEGKNGEIDVKSKGVGWGWKLLCSVLHFHWGRGRCGSPRVC